MGVTAINSGILSNPNQILRAGFISSTGNVYDPAVSTPSEDWQLPVGHWEPSVYPLEIYQPRAGRTTADRFYKAYPGIEYNVRVAVAWGAFPYNFELTNGPSGMSINSSTGEISWANPSGSPSPNHNTAVLVTDQEGSTATVSWTIEVNSAGFLFIDAVNGTSAGGGGTGTLANPLKTMADIWLTAGPNDFIYFRDGTYALDQAATGSYINWNGSSRPCVLLAYPNESPIIDHSTGNDAYIFFQPNNNTLYVDGLDFDSNGGTTGRVVQVSTSVGTIGVTFIRNTFRDLVNTGPTNDSLLFFSGGNGVYNSITNNIFSNSVGYGLLGYSNDKMVVQNNTVTGTVHAGISPKSNNNNWIIRQNTITADPGTASLFLQEYHTSGDPPGQIEVSYNLILCPDYNVDNACRLIEYGTKGDFYLFRNTFYGIVHIQGINSNTGPYEFTRNVIINADGDDGITEVSVTDPTKIIITDNLNGGDIDNIIDSNGDLTAAYSAYEGTHGHNIS